MEILQASPFSADPDFCLDCGAILPLPQAKGSYVTCCVCQHHVDVKEFNGMTFESEIVFNTVRKHAKTNPDVAEGPLVDRKCARCGHECMSYATLQTRSVDEGQTVFYTCPQCRHKEIENS